MMRQLRNAGLLAVLALLVIGIAGCEGERGPAGPAGEKGDKGDPGDPGGITRVIITGTVPAEDPDFAVTVEELTFDDFPLVTVFVQISPDEWDELPFYWDQLSDQPLWASLAEGQVTLYNCNGLEYIILVIK
ncbi:MAG: hypothetical protein AB1752_13430 [Candidatus Zixiibacteriota bacterium]